VVAFPAREDQRKERAPLLDLTTLDDLIRRLQQWNVVIRQVSALEDPEGSRCKSCVPVRLIRRFLRVNRIEDRASLIGRSAGGLILRGGRAWCRQSGLPSRRKPTIRAQWAHYPSEGLHIYDQLASSPALYREPVTSQYYFEKRQKGEGLS
jgi:hypothetical protein